MQAYEIKLYGRVQRIGFRRYILTVARSLKLSGYVENLPDDTVVVARSESLKSIHKHNAFAERKTTIGELKR